jgi:hypothetical protein
VSAFSADDLFDLFVRRGQLVGADEVVKHTCFPPTK